MPDFEKLASVVAKDLFPIVVDHVVEERRAHHMQRIQDGQMRRLDKEGEMLERYHRLHQQMYGGPAPTQPQIEPHSHPGDDCPTCSRTPDQSHPHSHVEPHGVSGAEDPHLDYTRRELAKHLALLQNHFTDYRCGNCISKHGLIIEGLAEEGLSMVHMPEEKEAFQGLIGWAQSMPGRRDYDALVDESRQIRIGLTGMSHEEPETAARVSGSVSDGSSPIII